MSTKRAFVISDFNEFFGPVNMQMRYLVKEGYVPINAAQVMASRLEGILSFDKGYHTGDALLRHPDGRVKLVHDAPALRSLVPGSSLDMGFRSEGYSSALKLTWEKWEQHSGEQISTYDMQALLKGKPSTRAKLEDMIWNFLARGDTNLLTETEKEITSRAEAWLPSFREHGYRVMGVRIPRWMIAGDIDTPLLYQWSIDSVIDFGFGRASADCYLNSKNFRDIRLVGVKTGTDSKPNLGYWRR